MMMSLMREEFIIKAFRLKTPGISMRKSFLRISKQRLQCELFAKFYNNSKELKGQVIRLQRIEPNKEIIKVTAGWGSNVKGPGGDLYTVELIFMDKLMAAIPFTVGDEFEEGSNEAFTQQRSIIQKPSIEELDLSFDELLER